MKCTRKTRTGAVQQIRKYSNQKLKFVEELKTTVQAASSTELKPMATLDRDLDSVTEKEEMENAVKKLAVNSGRQV